MNEQQLILEPYFDRLFVKRDDTIEKTAHGVIIPDGDKEKPSRGVVVAVGPDCKTAWKGQRIIWGQHHGFDLQVGTEDVTVLREQDIYAGEKKDPNARIKSAFGEEVGIRKHTPKQFKETLDDIIGK